MTYVWLGMTKSKQYGLFFFVENSIMDNYLNKFLETQPQYVDTVVFQRDGAPPHIAWYCIVVLFLMRWSLLPNALRTFSRSIVLPRV